MQEQNALSRARAQPEGRWGRVAGNGAAENFISRDARRNSRPAMSTVNGAAITGRLAYRWERNIYTASNSERGDGAWKRE